MENFGSPTENAVWLDSLTANLEVVNGSSQSDFCKRVEHCLEQPSSSAFYCYARQIGRGRKSSSKIQPYKFSQFDYFIFGKDKAAQPKSSNSE
jgi:hypothetical protein